MNLCDIKTIRQLMAMFSLNFRKEFGQNFLIDTHVLDKIICESGVNKDDLVIEIGPGIGRIADSYQ